MGREENRTAEEIKKEVQDSWIGLANLLSIEYNIYFLDALKLNIFVASFMLSNIKNRNELRNPT